MPNDSLLSLPRAARTLTAMVLEGLSQPQKELPAKLFYDDEGCRLFYRITELPEYYLTRTELALLHRIAPAVAAITAGPTALVEYGASDETKALMLLRQKSGAGEAIFTCYVPIDVASAALAHMRDRLGKTMCRLRVHAIAADFMDPVILPREADGLARLGFFPGSTIGNLDLKEALRFLAQARITLGLGAHLLVGVDLRKDPAILIPAYDDAAGVTAAFNLNLLARLNREAHADFDLGSFTHRAMWNDAESRVEMHLVSRREQIAHVEGHVFRFGQGETIHTENSYKHTPERFAALASRAGWSLRDMWTDLDELFSLHLLAA